MTAKKYETLDETQVKKALDEKYVPNDETIRAMEECERKSPNDDIIEADELAKYLKKLADE